MLEDVALKRNIQMKCTSCQYEWVYKGRMYSACCPRCRHLTKINVFYSLELGPND
jgi:hypothetical protein